MKTVFIFLLTIFSNLSLAHSGDSLKVNQPIQKEIEVIKSKQFFIESDWILETKAELINGISCSPTLEFNISCPNGFNFQFQTGALPIMNGLKINKTQPAAGFSFSYKF